jgi:hypothetical protein
VGAEPPERLEALLASATHNALHAAAGEAFAAAVG